MATRRAYYGHDRDREYFERVFQSANINFLIGSGASLPAINVLGEIENELQELIRNEEENEYFNKAAEFLKAVWFANNILIGRNHSGESFSPDMIEKTEQTKNNYAEFLFSIEKILTRRRTGLLPRRVNIFTTNYDLFIEYAATKNHNLEFNDGFSRRVSLYNQSAFDAKSFYRSIHATGNLYNYSVELPTVNLIKLHGSLSWKKNDNDIIYVLQDLPPKRFSGRIHRKKWVNAHALILPRKDKFKETLLENVYYDLLRTYSNELDKEGTLLVVFGFSFADEHIELLTKKALRNATLKILVFAYNEASRDIFEAKFSEFSNVEIVYRPGSTLDFGNLNHIITNYLRG
ncbi:SIR2 family protein [Acerihabitans sp. KWT182]|uniref:SIR2 family protein n=1 Tax=Acerihabitans sp. KWT182 TaxID=3157919 RepID=A0AAU7Q805_9GAMM